MLDPMIYFAKLACTSFAVLWPQVRVSFFVSYLGVDELSSILSRW